MRKERVQVDIQHHFQMPIIPARGRSPMRHVIICQEQAFLAQSCPPESEENTLLYLVDDRSLQRKLSKAGHKALSGNLRDHRIYQRANIGHQDQILIQVRDPHLAEDIVHQLWQIHEHPSVAVITDNGFYPTLPPTVKHVSMAKLLSEASSVELRRARNHQMVQQLQEVLGEVKNLLILVQHDPDPDAIASALALRAVLGRNKTTTPIGSFGQVTRPENVTMIQLLDVEIERITPEKLKQYDGVALVDVQPPYFGELLSEADAVIDHHPCVAPYTARYQDIRTSFGATATIFVQYLQAIDAKITQRLATALYYGIKTDTLFLGRETTEADIEAFTCLYPRANHSLIRRMERPKLPLRDLDAFGYALRARMIVGTTFFTHLGIVEREDVLPQFAEFCLQVECVERAVVSGIFGGNLVVSVRNEAHGKSAGELVRNAFGYLGSAGGHRCMAKAVVPLTALEQEFGRLSDTQLGQLIQNQMMPYLGVPVAV
jgi:nanoRNase/pAp phosphatase (c-di-AMP/oligoRNAs hydrolase)